MKKKYFLRCMCLVAVFFAFNLSPFTSQAQVNWHTIDDAAQAKIGTRIYFVDFYTSWCGWCKKMDRDTYADPIVVKILNKYYYPVKFDAEGSKKVIWNGRVYPPATAGRNGLHSFASTILGKQAGFPSAAFLRADGSLVQVVPGYFKPQEFATILWYFASGDCNKYSFEQYQKIFEKEILPEMQKQLDN